MCDGGRRCPEGHGNPRRAADRARYAAKKAAALDGDLSAETTATPAPSRPWAETVDVIDALRVDVARLLAEAETARSKHGSRIPTEARHRYEDAEELICKIGALVDAEVLARSGPQPEQATDEEIVSAYTAYDTATNAMYAAQNARDQAYFALQGRKNGEDHDPALADAYQRLETEDLAAGEVLAEVMSQLQAVLHLDRDKSWRRQQGDIARTVIGELRPLGATTPHEFHPAAQKPAVAAVTAAFATFPADWVAASAANSSPLSPRVTRGRAHYVHDTRVKVATKTKTGPVVATERARNVEALRARADRYRTEGSVKVYVNGRRRARKVLSVTTNEETCELELTYAGGVVTTSAGYESSSVLTTDKSAEVTLHEVTHRMEYANPHIVGVEGAFYRRRTAGDDATRYAPGRSTERVRADGFVTDYIGKDYDGRAYEVMSMGMEAIFTGSQGALLGIDTKRADPDHRAFVLGTLVAV